MSADSYKRGIKGEAYPRSTLDYAFGPLETDEETLKDYEEGKKDRARIQEQEKIRSGK